MVVKTKKSEKKLGAKTSKQEESLGTIGGKKIVSLGEKGIDGRSYNEVKCEDGSVYFLNDHDLKTQVKL